jgi:hypothetical protein
MPPVVSMLCGPELVMTPLKRITATLPVPAVQPLKETVNIIEISNIKAIIHFFTCMAFHLPSLYCWNEK